MTRTKKNFYLILLLVLGLLIFNLPASFSFTLPTPYQKTSFSFTKPSFLPHRELKKGLDLQGGVHLSLETDMSALDSADYQDALESVREVISRRVDLYGVTETVIQTSFTDNHYRLIVELPGISDINQAVDLIGQTAQLDFRQDTQPDAKDFNYASPSAILRIYSFTPTGLTGKDLKKASVNFNQSGQTASEPVVSLEFTPEGTKKFAAITQKNLNLPVAIFLDNQLLTSPVVNDVIADGRAVISGNFTPEAASQMAIQLNAGALPVPIKIVEQKNIGASLGENSVKKSLIAGGVGLSLVMLFMVMYYGKNGLIANLGLLIYGLITLTVYKLIPVTLTLPGIAGFILSVGMAVDSNILVFERLKEELRDDRPFAIALELGFGRAWDSIKDANLATIITSLVLINPLNWSFLNTSGLVRGFALTLFIGVLISLFTGIVVTRTLMRHFLLKANQSKKQL